MFTSTFLWLTDRRRLCAGCGADIRDRFLLRVTPDIAPRTSSRITDLSPDLESRTWPQTTNLARDLESRTSPRTTDVSRDLAWHAACLRCAACAGPLDESCTCFVRDKRTYCKLDYMRCA